MEDKAKGWFLDYHKNLEQKNLKGQIAVIITLVIALIFLFTVVFMNIAKLSNIKIRSAKANDRAALQLASRIGSISHYLKEEVMKGDTAENCNLNWMAIGMIIGGILLSIISLSPLGAFVLRGMSALEGVLAGGVVAFGGLLNALGQSKAVIESIYDKISTEMSDYNAIRETTLLETLSYLETDDFILTASPGKPGFFFEDWNNNGQWEKDGDGYSDTNGNGVWDSGDPYVNINGDTDWDPGEPYEDLNENGKYDPPEPITRDFNNNGIYDPPELEYDLSDIPDMRNKPSVGRFYAWYYSKRFPLIAEPGLPEATEDFVKDLKEELVTTYYDNSKWEINQLAFITEPTSAGYGRYMRVTSGSPSWVYDHSGGDNRVKALIIDVDERDEDGSGYYVPFGFLKEKFWPWAADLEAKGYKISFCATPLSWLCRWCQPTCNDIGRLINSLTLMMGQAKDLFSKTWRLLL